MQRSAFAMLLAGLQAAACSGAIGNGREDGSGGAGERTMGAGGAPRAGAGGAGGGAPAADRSGVTSMAMRRLTREEYDRTTRDLLGDQSAQAAHFADDPEGATGFLSPGLVTLNDVRAYMAAAETLSAAMLRDLSKLPACRTAADEACATTFLRGFGRRAFRRPLLDDEIESLLVTYREARTALGLGFDDAVAVLVETILQSPSFLYRWELGPVAAHPTTDGRVALTGYELASRLSYLAWGSMPDDVLLAQADAGKLTTADQLEAQLARMLKDPRARDGIATFHRQWLRLSNPYQAASDPSRREMNDETSAFSQAVVLDGDGRLETLLTMPAVAPGSALAAVYGVTAQPGKAGLTMTDGSQRSGILTQANFLASHAAGALSHPVKRGAVIWSRMLCGELPPMPGNVPPPQPPSPNVSTRERFAEHSSNACAKACHSLLDPPGFALENFDGTGRFRQQDGGKPVDASGDLTTPSGQHITFTTFSEFTHALAATTDASHCLAVQWARYGLARIDPDADDVVANQSLNGGKTSDTNVPALLGKLVRSEAFRYRLPSEGELTQ
jgi:hypothetical protein